MRAATKLLELAVALARDHEQERDPLVPALGKSLRAIGELRRAEEILNEVASNRGQGPARLAFLEAVSLRDYTEANAASFQALERAPRGVPESDPEVLARAKIVEVEVFWTLGKYLAIAEPLSHAKKAARKVGDQARQRSLVNSSLAWEARALLLGPEKAKTGLARCEKILAATDGSRALEASVLAVKAGFHAMLGNFPEARKHYKESRRIGEAFGLASWLAALPLYSGPVELLDERAADAARQLRRGFEALERMGDRSRRATTAAFLAQALYLQQLDDQAEEKARKSEELAAGDDVFTQVVWRGALAKVLARRGDLRQAQVLAGKAVALAEKTDGLNLRGDALLDQAEVLRATDPSNARKTAERAREPYGDKGNVAALRRVEAFIARLPS